jgi:hypothetical protein
MSKTIKTTETEVETVKVEETLEQLMTRLTSKSAVIRFLASEGKTRGQIAKFMNIRYQHVRNVLITPVKKA